MMAITKKLCMAGTLKKVHADFKRLIAFCPLVTNKDVKVSLMYTEATGNPDEIIAVWEVVGSELDVDDLLRKVKEED